MSVSREMNAVSAATEQIGDNRVKMRVEVPESGLKGAIDAVYQRWATEIKVPGFRKGKVPRQIIDARIGVDAIREQALEDALPDFYREAIKANDVHPIAPPEIEVIEFPSGGPLVFEATVDVRPEFDLPDFGSLSVEIPSGEVTDGDVAEQLDRLRDRFAELETASREARRGDYVLIDLKGYRHEEPVEGAGAPDLLYEVGSRTGPPKLDDELEGNRAGAILKFNDSLPEGPLAGDEISFTVLVKEVKMKKLPPLDDDFAKTVGDFETLEELREDLRARLSQVKEAMVAEQARGLVLESLVLATNLTAPQGLVEQEFEHRLAHFNEDLQRAGVTMDDYARQAQLTELEIRRDIRAQADQGIKAELILEEIARVHEVDVTEEDIGQEVARVAMRAERDPKEVAEQLIASGRLSAVAADIMRRKALDLVVEKVNPTLSSDDEKA